MGCEWSREAQLDKGGTAVTEREADDCIARAKNFSMWDVWGSGLWMPMYFSGEYILIEMKILS